MKTDSQGTREVPTQIKNRTLVEERRRQIVDAAVQLFIERGYHKTTTRALARATGFSIGSIYEYVACKEDVLFLVCMAIHAEVENKVEMALASTAVGIEALREVIAAFFKVCDRMSDHILLMYQVTHFLPEKWQAKVLDAELRITGLLVEAVRQLNRSGEVGPLSRTEIDFVAHNISVLGHTWAFRRWYFSRRYSLEQYTEQQSRFIFGIMRPPETSKEA